MNKVEEVLENLAKECRIGSIFIQKEQDVYISQATAEIRDLVMGCVPMGDRAYLDYTDVCNKELLGVEAYVKQGDVNKIMQIIKSTEKAGMLFGRHRSLAEVRTALNKLFEKEREDEKGV